MKHILFVFALTLFSFNSFALSITSDTIEVISQQTTSIKVYIDAKGKVFVDGKKTSISKLKDILTQLKKTNGVVKFAMAKNRKQSTINKKNEVFKLIREHKLSTQGFTDNTFSERIPR